MNTIQVEEELKKLCDEVRDGKVALSEFPYRLMAAYQLPANQIKVIRSRNKDADATSGTTIGSKHKALYVAAKKGKAETAMADRLAALKTVKKEPRFVLVTDGDQFLAYDRTAGESSAFSDLDELPENYDFLMPMVGVERYRAPEENKADRSAARHMAKLYDAILAGNGPEWQGGARAHDLNLLMTRLLFCMYAQNTGIFPDNVFSALLHDETAPDGKDTNKLIREIFTCLDLRKNARDESHGRATVRRLPYVNGKLFLEKGAIPVFSRNARCLLIEAAGLNWKSINADIFGSMIQAIAHADMRSDFGMHYTSVPNIMKVLDPLFLSSLRAQLEAAGDNPRALERLIERISRIRVFDPACGSGNFLIISYRELRKIETEAFRRLKAIRYKGQLALADYHTKVKIGNFHGIDPSDFACQTAGLSLWISQYQMNCELDDICVTPPAALPLTDAGDIWVGNALRLDWQKVSPIAKDGETYVVGNPPYLGRAFQNDEQKSDIIEVFSKYEGSFKKLDYVACWFALAGEYLRKGATGAALVATNSICQGEQVSLLWPHVLDSDLEIGFAHNTFKWSNSAAKNAAVACVIVGLRKKSSDQRKLFSEDQVRAVKNINPYLAAAPDVIVSPITNGDTSRPIMLFGNMPRDDGNLILSDDERESILAEDQFAKKLIRRYVGSSELINDESRWCLWIEDSDLKRAMSIPEIARRVRAVKKFRAASTNPSTVAAAVSPHRFVEIRGHDRRSLVVPSVSSERRDYIPIAFCPKDTIVSNLAFVVTEPENWLFSVVASRLHMVWTKAVGGQLETRVRYSNTLVYNTFPVPDLSETQKDALSRKALDIVADRQVYCDEGRNLAWLYDPSTMPESLAKLHHELDEQFETIYNGAPFMNDEKRLENLFRRYARTRKDEPK